MNRKTLFWSTLFAISMGFFESAVVIYIRAIAYPGGFTFPLQPLPGYLTNVELLREFFSLVMLASVAFLLGKRAIDRFGWFLFNFAIWDLFYYLFLYLLIQWPESILTPDLLFLIPVPWVGPVVAPVLLSGLMIFLALLIFHFSKKIRYLHLRFKEVLVMTIGSLLCLFSFMIDALFSPYNVWSKQFQPGPFNWYLLGAGFLIILAGILMFLFKNRRKIKKGQP